MELRISFGEWLRQRREALDLTRAELAECAGCSVSALRKIEADERRPSRQLAELLAGCLRIAPEEQPLFLDAARGVRQVERLEAATPGRAIPSEAWSPVSPASSAGARLPAPVWNLPAPATPLIGREAELAMLAQLLDDPTCRLLTLIGPGGIGKTRLALEAACKAWEHFADGVYFASLASVNSPEHLVLAIAQAVGLNFAEPDEPRTQLVTYLRNKEMLLLLDNLEHLRQGVELLVTLLERAPRLTLLATSRERLQLSGEWIFEVQGLPVPTEGQVEGLASNSAVQLFLHRARRVRVGFELSVEDFPVVIRICRLVEGMPLAIELAAAWVPMLSCAEIADEIEHGLDILETSLRDIPERQRSMRALFDHSWKLLTEKERRVLCQLSFFRGGFERQAAQAVACADLHLLSALVTKSFLRHTSLGRFTMHELTRQYCVERLRDDAPLYAQTEELYVAFYLALAEQAAVQLKGTNQLQWLDRLEQEHDNMRTVLINALAGDGTVVDSRAAVALQLAGVLSSFWFMRGYLHEGRGWLQQLLERSPGVHTASCARALMGAAGLTNALGEHDAALALAEESVAIYRELGNRQGLADALTIKGAALRWQGKVTLGNGCILEALGIYREAEDRWSVARNLYELGKYLADFSGDASGYTMLEESAAILQELGDKYVFTGVLISLGVTSIGRADYASARTYFERSLAIAREIGYLWPAADALTNLGYVLRLQGDFASARAHFEEAIHLYRDGGSRVWDLDPLCALAETDILQGELAAARQRLDEVCPRLEMAGNQWLQVLAAYLQGILAYYEGDTGSAIALLEETVRFARLGGYKPDLARSLIALSRAMWRRGAEREAAVPLHEGLCLFLDLGHKLGLVTALEGLAELAAEDAARAAKLLATAHVTREEIGALLPPVDCPDHEGVLAVIRTQLTEEAFAQAWAEGQAIAPEQAAASVLAEAYPGGIISPASGRTA